MANNFMNLKRDSSSAIDKYKKKVEDLNSGSFAKDERYWFPVQDKAGNASAVIRFLPPSEGEDAPFVRLFSHGFKGPGGWYIENSPNTIGQDCPVTPFYFDAKDSGDEKLANKLSRRMGFISNIYVVKHAARPEDEGKVFLFKYGKKIFDKLNDKMTPPDADMEPIDPFNLWTGANFRLRIKKVGEFNNYDGSEFDPPSPLTEDEALEKIWKSQYKLAPEIAADKIKPFDELKKKLYKVLGKDPSEEATKDSPREETPRARKEATAQPKDETPPPGDAEGISFFQNMLADRKKKDLDAEIPF
jgi:hypothetical protein